MRYLSVCSGIEAATVAWAPLGWSPVAFSEIAPFPCAVLAHHYPDVPNLGDMTRLPDLIRVGLVEAPDILCGGPPCQPFSVAGLRKSLDDERGNLSLIFCEIANAIDISRAHDNLEPCIVFWENVPGVLSAKDNAFGCFLAGLAGEDDPLQPPGGKWTNAGVVLGPKRAVAWRVLDAQYFGLAQRRRRVFVVASAREGFDPAAVLFEFDGVRRDTAPSREAGKESAGRTARSVALRGREGGGTAELGDELQNCLRGEGFDASEDGTGRGTPLVPVAFHGSQDPDVSGEVTHPVGRNQGRETCVYHAAAVRRLTPRECERLQGFPDDYTLVPLPLNGRQTRVRWASDSARYKALGNSWAAPVVRWIGERINAVEQIKHERKAA